jgi:hypothetical protein
VRPEGLGKLKKFIHLIGSRKGFAVNPKKSLISSQHTATKYLNPNVYPCLCCCFIVGGGGGGVGGGYKVIFSSQSLFRAEISSCVL